MLSGRPQNRGQDGEFRLDITRTGFEDAAVEKGQAVPHLCLQGAFMNSHEKRGTFG